MKVIDKDVAMLSETLGIDVQKLYQYSNNQPKHYTSCTIKKPNGKERKLSVPNKYLKYIQRQILDNLLYTLPISDYATAYCKGKKLADNATEHIGKKKILKLDISGFFDSIDYEMVHAVFRRLKLSNAAVTLLSNICTLNSVLPQGAPTSPYIANLVMNYFDERVGVWCAEKGIFYTRYCDDMTFSGDFNEPKLIGYVNHMLTKQGFELNRSKSKCVHSSQQQVVTGVVVNEKPQVSSEKRRKIIQEVYYCTKYGASDCIQHLGLTISENEYINSLRGRISFVLQINPDDKKMGDCFEEVCKLNRSKK